jgi:2',3'-cyclic-nucleotide 2'-phosphodiesterase (5'-nucleotidase family)
MRRFRFDSRRTRTHAFAVFFKRHADFQNDRRRARARKFNLNFDAQTKKLESIDWEIIPVTDKIESAPEFAAVFDKYKDLLQKLAEPVGRRAVLDALSLSNRTKETNVGNFIADAYRNAAKSDVALVNGGSIRADLTYNPGVLTKRDVLSILPFNNPIVKVEIPAKLCAKRSNTACTQRRRQRTGTFSASFGNEFCIRYDRNRREIA